MIRSIKLTKNPFDVAVHRRAIQQALDTVASLAELDFQKTTATWGGKPSFGIESPSEFTRVIGTDDENYQRIDEGTRPHVIVAHGEVLAFAPGGSPKTRPRVIGSRGGSKGSTVVFTKRVHHPGTEAREFSDVVGEKAGVELARQMELQLGRI